VRVTLNDGEDVIEIVRHSGRQLANRFELLDMPKLRFEAEALGRVAAVAVDNLARSDGEERPGKRSPLNTNFLAQFALPEAQTLLCDGRRIARQQGFGPFQS